MLAPALAQGIAGDTSAIIGYNVLITDRDGVVIGSGDTSRIGSFHEASVQVMLTQEAAAHSAGEARRLRGVRPGITLPIVIDGDAVGTVGITGSPAQVGRFGRVVKRQTEILLQESLLLRSRLLRERAAEDLLREIAHFDPEVVSPDDLVARSADLGYDLRAPRVAVIVDIGATGTPVTGPSVSETSGTGTSVTGRSVSRGDPSAPDTETRNSSVDARAQRADADMLRALPPRLIREAFADSQDLVAGMASGRFAVLHQTRDRPVRDLVPLCESIVEGLERRLAVPVRIGIGAAASSVAALRDSYEDAASALRLGPRARPGISVHVIEDLRVHRLIAAVAPRTRARFTASLIPALRARSDWPVLRRTIMVWCESGFSLVRTASTLNIHRNTLIYRLDRIAHLSGHPVRDHPAALALYLACIADQVEPHS
ncbi:sugar diacid utilization regulator [Actinomadura rudentiformis]|uniref:Sugar diacid utilization regulator n=1 Tax=Actinomadura rudentiformis TaxID=359158 RepID=A0A6H9YKI2_9ACTN|nr:sugar diacid utilization regulator [Actinomadura rudentiformis]